MKLNRETRDYVSVGDELVSSCARFAITNKWKCWNGGICISVKWLEGPEHMIGRTNYGEPLSNFYGYDIVLNSHETMRTKTIKMGEVMYDRICAILTDYENGCEHSIKDMYGCLCDLQEMYLEAEE